MVVLQLRQQQQLLLQRQPLRRPQLDQIPAFSHNFLVDHVEIVVVPTTTTTTKIGIKIQTKLLPMTSLFNNKHGRKDTIRYQLMP